jgi:ribonuclease P protein component
LERLRTRASFKAVAGGKRVSRDGFVLQALRAPAGAHPNARFGFTVTKKIGNAVVRNRIRRRLREVVRLAGNEAESDVDYVLVGRRAALSLEFERLVADLLTGFTALARRDDKPKTESVKPRQ